MSKIINKEIYRTNAKYTQIALIAPLNHQQASVSGFHKIMTRVIIKSNKVNVKSHNQLNFIHMIIVIL